MRKRVSVTISVLIFSDDPLSAMIADWVFLLVAWVMGGDYEALRNMGDGESRRGGSRGREEGGTNGDRCPAPSRAPLGILGRVRGSG